MQDVKAMKIVYKSDFPVRVSLPQEPLDETRNSCKKELPSSADWNTKELIVNSIFFRKPRACPSNLDDVELDLSKVTSITFSPVLLDTTRSGKVELKEVVCYGAGELGTTEINKHTFTVSGSEIIINRMNRKVLHVSVATPGNYSFGLYDLKGRILAQANSLKLTKGSHAVRWNAAPSSCGVFLLKVKGLGGESIERFVGL
ncbi:MAG: hypothetical protein GY852_02525 [bacterium]|nr:hypothetical protein [bacterium]